MSLGAVPMWAAGLVYHLACRSDGIEAKTVVLKQLRAAPNTIEEHNPARITTLGGECSVNMAPVLTPD